jgi:hypothetical protein
MTKRLRARGLSTVGEGSVYPSSHAIGWALLIAGLGGIALLALVREVPDTLKGVRHRLSAT